MDYTNRVAFTGITEKAFDLAVTSLTSIGFRIASKNSSSLDMTGPGMNSTRQSALLGASRILVTHSNNELLMEAELGGVKRMRNFVIFFPIGLVFLLCVVLGIVFSLTFDDRQWLLPVVVVTGINALVWVALGPIMARSMQTRTSQALDALLNNMAITADNS